MQCVDAETLAAWADGGLPKAEAAAVELHLSECDRCTAMVATFVRATPDAPAAESLWRRWNLRWLVPVATAATVAALWVLIPSPEPVPMARSESDVATQAPAPAASQPPSATQDQKIEDARAQSNRAAAVGGREEAAPQLGRRQASDQAREDLRAEERAAASPSAPAPAATPPAREADRADGRVTGLQERAELAAPPAAPAAGRAAAPTSAAAESPTSAAAESNARRLRQADARAFAAVVAQFQVVSPDPLTRWRVIGAGQVERSTNGGMTWEPAALPESATLTGGSSPAPSICWLVGRTGSIYVTTDGRRFIRVPFPDRADVVSIQATDGRRATVVTTDGRTMRTEDQGANWNRIAP